MNIKDIKIFTWFVGCFPIYFALLDMGNQLKQRYLICLLVITNATKYCSEVKAVKVKSAPKEEVLNNLSSLIILEGKICMSQHIKQVYTSVGHLLQSK